MLKLFDEGLSAISAIGNLVDDWFDMPGEKADRELELVKIKGQVEVAALRHELAKQEAVHRVAEAQARAASAQAAGRSWLQRNLFPLCSFAFVGLIGSHMAGVTERPIPLEAWALFLVVAGGGVIDHRLFAWIRSRRQENPSP